MNGLRILALTNLYPIPARPTFAAYNRQQFAALSEIHQLRIICPVPWPLAAREALRGRPVGSAHPSEGGVEVHTPTFIFPPRVLSHRYGEFFERSVSRVAFRLLDSYKPHVILSSWAYPDGWAAVRIGRSVGLPVVIKVVGTDVRVLADGHRREPTAEALAGADAVVTVSEELRKRVIELGASPGRVHVVPEGINDSLFVPGSQERARRQLGLSHDRKIILFVGNVLASKGAIDLVRACSLLRRKGVAFECHFVGQGRDADRVQRLIDDDRLGRLVTLKGPRPLGELPQWYHASDVVALPSYSEGIPNVLREAIACGRPFVATDAGGIPEIADPSYSRLVEPSAVDQLARALEAMLQSPPVVDPDVVRRVNVNWARSAAELSSHLQAAVAGRSASFTVTPSLAALVGA